MNAFLSRWQRDYAAQRRMRWICKGAGTAGVCRDVFPDGGRRTLAVIAVVSVVFCCGDVAVNDWRYLGRRAGGKSNKQTEKQPQFTKATRKQSPLRL